MDLRRPHLTLRDFFLYEQRMVAEAQIHKFFSKLIWSLIVLNVLIGIPTIYDKFFYIPDTSIPSKHIDELHKHEV
jgi:hypothetical protein